MVRTCCIALLYCWSGAGGAPALAAQYDFGLGYSLAHDSNVTRGAVILPGCANPPCAEWTEQLLGGFGYEEHGPELNARLLAQVERRHFVRNVYQDDTGGFIDGAAVWTLSPRRFTWSVEDVYREANLNPRAQDTPDNRAKTNSLSTGPDFTFRVNPANSPVIGARYGRFNFKSHGGNNVQGLSDVQGLGDNQRYTAYARWLHQVSAPTTLSLNFEATRINFAPPARYTHLFREDLFFRYDLVSLYNQQRVDVGATRLVRYGGQELNGRLVRYTGQSSPTSQTALRVLLADEISDTYSDMIRKVTSSTVPTMPVIQTDAAATPFTATNVAAGDVYHSRRGELTYVNRGERFGYGLQGNVGRVDYDDPLLPDYNEKGGRISVTWLFSVEAQAYAFTRYMRRTFRSLDERDTDRNRGLGVINRISRTLTLTLEAGQTERQSTLPQFTFVDRRVMLLLGYSTGPLFSPRIRR